VFSTATITVSGANNADVIAVSVWRDVLGDNTAFRMTTSIGGQKSILPEFSGANTMPQVALAIQNAIDKAYAPGAAPYPNVATVTWNEVLRCFTIKVPALGAITAITLHAPALKVSLFDESLRAHFDRVTYGLENSLQKEAVIGLQANAGTEASDPANWALLGDSRKFRAVINGVSRYVNPQFSAGGAVTQMGDATSAVSVAGRIQSAFDAEFGAGEVSVIWEARQAVAS
jgi:hypothetical protein